MPSGGGVHPIVPGGRGSAILRVYEQAHRSIPPILNAEGGAVDAGADDDLVALGPHPLDGAQGDAVGLGEGLGIATDHLIGRIAQTAKHRRVQLPVLRACHEFAKVTLARNRHEVVNEYDTRPTIKVEETHFRRGPAILGKMEPKLK